MDAAVAVANALAKMIFFNVVLRAGAPRLVFKPLLSRLDDILPQ
jgi:hypothetical protein